MQNFKIRNQTFKQPFINYPSDHFLAEKGETMRNLIITGVLMVLVLFTFGCSTQVADKADDAFVKQELNKLAPVALECDLSSLSANDKLALEKLVEAAKIMDQLFLIQVDPRNPEIRIELENDPTAKDHLALFDIMFGPWDRLMEDKPFVGTEEKPAGAGFYPTDMTKQEFEKAIADNPDMEEEFTSSFTVIERQNGKLVPVPFHEHYKQLVDHASALLNDAAELTDDPTLKTFLSLRAKALTTDDYYESDMAWMDLAGDLEIVIGPYEVYEDGLFNYKAAYEAFLCTVDHEESKKLEHIAQYLNDMEAYLPIPDKYKNFNRGSSSPIKVVQEVFSAGDTKAGIQTTAFNLPNDERVREAKGSKKVLLKNIARAKYDKCWIPIANTILAPDALSKVSFDCYFNHVLMHEVSHGLGPGNITLKDGTKSTVGKELKDLYSTIEECKADILGLYFEKFMIDKGVFSSDLEEYMYATYLGGMFRSIRFGIDEAHGGGVAIQFNYLVEKGAFYEDENGKLNVNEEKVMPAIRDLAATILTLQANGDYDAAKSLVDQYRKSTPLMQRLIDELKDVPVDIHPSYPVLNELAGN